jgi:phosphopantothenoylcysteine decarboxylase / phosphopantothenate---cysteine ligase
MATLEARGVRVAGPATGAMAEPESGPGRLLEPAELLDAARAALAPGNGPLAGRHALVTSGPTHEPIDPVRYIANRSSGRQGHAIAAALAALGARVTLVSGPVAVPDPPGVDVHRVETAREMLAACEGALPADVAVMAAAVADWRTAREAGQKMKKEPGAAAPVLEMALNPDILATVAAHATRRPRLVIGFAAETEDLAGNARRKLAAKGCDWIIANDVSREQGTFGGVLNSVQLIRTGAEPEIWPRLAKAEVAVRLVARIAAHFEQAAAAA